MNNVAKVTQLFQVLNAGYEAWKREVRRAPSVSRVEPPHSNFLWDMRNGEARHQGGDTCRETEHRALQFTGRTRAILVVFVGETRNKGVGRIKEGGERQTWIRQGQVHAFTERFRWHTHDMRAIHGDKIREEKRGSGLTSDYPTVETYMY